MASMNLSTLDIEHIVRRLAALDSDRDYILAFFAPADRKAVAPIVDRVLRALAAAKAEIDSILAAAEEG